MNKIIKHWIIYERKVKNEKINIHMIIYSMKIKNKKIYLILLERILLMMF